MRRTLPLLAAALLVPVFASAQTPASQPASQPAPPKDVLNDMLKPGSADRMKPLQPVPGPPLQDRTTVNNVFPPGMRPITLRREGSYVVDRTGRVTKSADGKNFEFNFEADAQTLQDPPMVLLPGLTLMMMQDQVKSSSRDLRFRVTGMVTEYLGRNYLLLQKAVVVADFAGIGGS